MHEDDIATHSFGQTLRPTEKSMEHLRHALDVVNCRIEGFAGIAPGTNRGSTDMIGYWARHSERTCAEDYDNPDQRRECLAVMALDAESRKKLLDACQERDTVIRNLRATDAAANRAQLVGAEHVKEIAWDSPVANEAFQCLVKAIVWDGPGARMDPWECSQIHNPITDEVAFDQLTLSEGQALYHGLVCQLTDVELGELETTLSDIQSTTWETGERNGLHFLLSFVHRAQREHERAKCVNCGSPLAGVWDGEDESGLCFICDSEDDLS